MKEDTSESRLTIDIPFQMIDRADKMMTERVRSDQIFGSLSQTKSRNQSVVHLLSEMYSPLDFKTAVTTVWHRKQIQLHNDTSLFFKVPCLSPAVTFSMKLNRQQEKTKYSL